MDRLSSQLPLIQFQADESKKEETATYTCWKCGTESICSLDVMEIFGKIRCHNCGQEITE